MAGSRTIVIVMFVAVMASGLPGASAQGNPTGGIRGQIVDPEKLPVPGATVTVVSPALQGTRSAVTSGNGDFLIPFLPPGEYLLTVDISGFRSVTRTIGVAMAETVPVHVELTLATVAETVSVTPATSTEISKTSAVARTYAADLIERLPMARSVTGATLLAPGVTPNGPSGQIVMSGALSYENLFLIDGATVNEGLRGQPLPFFIEDAIQETKVSTGGISAEYGRFEGGVVNVLTKSGGNRYSGSFRTGFTNDSWRALTPYPGDRRLHNVTPTYQATAGGPLRRNRIWFFGAGRATQPQRNQTLDFTHINYTLTNNDVRGEAKVTYHAGPRGNLRASYTTRGQTTANASTGKVMDVASLYDASFDQRLSVVNYTGALTNLIFLEGQYSRKLQIARDYGSRFSDLVKGTRIVDRSRTSASFNSPRFCAVCGSGWLDARNNWDWFLKLTSFVSTASTGSHHVVAGFDTFKETRKHDAWMSGSGYQVQATRTIIDGEAIYPVFTGNSTFIDYLPLVAESVGDDIRTYSGFINDAWRYNQSLSFTIGVRYDQNRSRDQTGVPAVRDANFSPRLGLTWNVGGHDTWTLNAGFARYVSAISSALVDAGSAGGRTATYSYFYQGPPINAGSGPYLTADRALPLLFDWFFANGGLGRATRNAPIVPGLTTHVAGHLRAPNAEEYTIGVAREIGRRGLWRVDYVSRRYRDLYGDFLTTPSGRVADGAGRQYDLVTVRNNPDATRTYNGFVADATYRLPSLRLGGNYTLAWSRGNTDGENAAAGPTRTIIGTYPEYREARWNFPMGYSASDQRHKLRAWATWRAPIPRRFGATSVGIVQRIDSARPYDAHAPIDPRPYVANPGYVTPPSTLTYYFSPRNGLRWKTEWATDVAINWSRRIPGFGTPELFFHGGISNVLNNAAVITGDSTILTAASPGSRTDLQPFNPFTTAPIQDVNWAYGPEFGQPISVTSYQRARTFSFSAGIRF